MSRYTGPRSRVSRRLGVNIFGTKGEVIALDRRPYPPGEHGRSRRRGNVSEYLYQLQEKQKARFTYGLTERQFRNLYDEANRKEGVTGENMLRLLEPYEIRMKQLLNLNQVYAVVPCPTGSATCPKVLHRLAGRALVQHVLDPAAALQARQGDLSLLKTAKRWLHRDVEKVPATALPQLAQARAAHPVLDKMVTMREELRQLWLNTSQSREQLAADLQAWCRRAEESGIAQLQQFSMRLRAARA